MRKIVVAAGLLGLVGSAAFARERDRLLKIVESCVQDDGGPDYCTRCFAPLPARLKDCVDAAGLSREETCRKTTEVWDKTAEFVAIRDLKMCGCPEGFVHGLALPLSRVTGSEDPKRPAGIWKFAWESAVRRIGAERAVVLAVNPRSTRSQDQLHIHLLQLSAGARRRLLAARPVRVKALSQVWDAAAGDAAARGLAADDIGIAVARDRSGAGFVVATSSVSVEKEFVVSCRARDAR